MRALAIVSALCVIAMPNFGCRGLQIPDGQLQCGPHGECPSPYTCNTHGRCSLERSDGSGDGDGDVAPSNIEGGHLDSATGGPFLLSVTTSGPSGTGMVLSTTTGVDINCGATCSALVTQGTIVQLVASPSSTGSFSSWTGCTSVDGTACTAIVTGATTVTATFKLKNGSPCAQTSDCATGFCVANVCCTTACDGPCNSSCSTGSCVRQPARTACGTRPGPSGAGSGSDVALICDGLGNCVAPVIECPPPDLGGGTTCDLGAMACCNLSFNVPNSRQLTCTNATSCGTPDEGDNNHGFSCSRGADCPLSQICCYQGLSSGGFWAICEALEKCDPNNAGTVLP
jgi:hypothetical protein